MANKRVGPMPDGRYEEVEERSGGMCERCLVMPATNVHHRRYLSRGGGHNIANLLHLCGAGNASGCHGEAHTGIGGEVGTSISRHYPRPESTLPLRDTLGRMWLLDDDGGRRELDTQPY